MNEKILVGYVKRLLMIINELEKDLKQNDVIFIREVADLIHEYEVDQAKHESH